MFRAASKIGAAFVFLLLISTGLSAQNTTVSCQALFRVAVETAAMSCSAVGNDEVCLGFIPVSTESVAEVSDFELSVPGDIETVDRMERLTTEIGDFTVPEFGIAQVNLHLGRDDDAPGNTTLLLIGNAEVTNRVQPQVTLPMTANTGVNVRVDPDASGGLAGSLALGEEVTATGRNVNASGETWIRIDFAAHRDGVGWVIAWALNSDGDPATLPEAQPNELLLAPMQDLSLSTSMFDAPCDPASDSGILMQTPAEAGLVTLIVNNTYFMANDATLFIQTDNEYMYVSNLAGELTLRAASSNQQVPPGSLSRIPLGEDGLAADIPVFPESYVPPVVERLPMELMSQPVTLPRPLTEIEILDAITPDSPESGTWVVTGDPAGCFPSTTADPVFSSDFILGAGQLTFAPDNNSFTFDGGPGGLSTHTLVAPDTYSFSVETVRDVTTFVTTIEDPETLITQVQYRYEAGDGNCQSGGTWIWSRIGD